MPYGFLDVFSRCRYQSCETIFLSFDVQYIYFFVISRRQEDLVVDLIPHDTLDFVCMNLIKPGFASHVIEIPDSDGLVFRAGC